MMTPQNDAANPEKPHNATYDCGPCKNGDDCNGNCDDAACWDHLRKEHRVSDNEFKAGVEQRYGSQWPDEIPPEAAISPAALAAKLGTKDCHTHFVVIRNGNIQFDTYAQTPKPTDGFSIAYLKGVCRLPGITEIEFYYSINAEADPTLSLHAHANGTSIYYGNLSEYHPGL